MRICMFSMLLPVHVVGGMEIHALELAKGVVKAGHEVVVITSRHPRGIEYENIEGIEVHYVNVDATSRKPMGKASLRKLEELHSKKRFDLIHSQSFAAFYYVNSDLIDKLKIPVVTTMHGTYINSIKSHLNQGLSLMLLPKIMFHLFNHQFRTKQLMRESEIIISVSNELKERIPKEFRISPRKVKAIYNGIDIKQFHPCESELKGDFMDNLVVLCVSVLHKQKGIHNLIKAFSRVQKEIKLARLVLVGDGAYKRELTELATKLEVDAIFVGEVDKTDLPRYYNLCDVYVLPTISLEGLPLTLLEAMACGKPVVASDIGGISTVIEDDVNGMLVEPNNIRGLSTKIIEILKNGRDAALIGSAARKSIEESYSMEKMVKDTISVYEGVVGAAK